MEMEYISLPVDKEAAELYQRANDKEKFKLQMLFSFIIRRQRQDRLNRLFAIMDKAGRQSKANGLTEEILEELLND
ncbi:MAG: hypothetical protein QG635_1517 [Bacteroidota bacterium]|nr:hypothetical protein [Bacteroidota bacterium]